MAPVQSLALVLTVPANEVELASDALWALGVAAVEERDAVVDGASTEDHFVELWTSLGSDVDAIRRAADGFPSRWRWRTVEIDAAVTESWRAHAVPSWIDRTFVVVPAWLDVATTPSVLRLDIDPGAAFGLGDHPSTILTLRMLRQILWPGATVLDVGCGSGVLAIAAARLGAPYVEAIDISAAALEATEDNAHRNGVDRVITVTGRPLASIDETFDVVLANLLAPVLVDLAADLRRVVSPSGELIVSGVLAGNHDHVVEALAPLHVVETMTREGWAALLLRH
jgi:ribosomal protein L11 methyltransferase